MAVWRVDNTNSSGVPAASLVRRYRTWTWIYLQVIGANAIRISADRATLEQPAGSAAMGGLKLAGASTVIFQGWWLGELWAIADAAGAAQPAQFDLEGVSTPIAYMPIPGEKQLAQQNTSNE